MFEKASRIKLRFASGQGLLTVEELWELSLQHLDRMAQTIKKAMREEGEESLLPTENKKAETHNELRYDILKHIISVRLAEQEKKKTANETKARIARLEELAMNKSDEQLASKSLEEIQKEIAELKEALV